MQLPPADEFHPAQIV